MQIRIFTILEMKEWICQGKGELSTDLISNARALAWINNPYAQDSYPAIAIAYENSKPVGYTAVMADEINGEPIFFGTTGFIDASMRGKGVGTQLYSAMMKACNMRWFASDSAPAALTISKKTGLGIYYYNRYYLGFGHSFSPTSLLHALWVRGTNHKVLKKIRSNAQLDLIRYIDAQTYAFIEQHAEKNLFHRSQKMLNWILQWPFISCAPDNLASYSSYDFGTAISQYTIYAFRIKLGDKLIGFAMFRLCMGELTLLYIYKYEEFASEVYASLVKHVLCQNLLRFRTFDKGLIDYYNQMGATSMNSKSRTIQVSLSVPADMRFDPSLILQGGDGDMFC